MKDDLFKGATSQFVDSKGKCRVINYSKLGISLITSPLPPFVELQLSRELEETTIKDAITFIKSNGLKIIYQDGAEDIGIQGLWLEHPQIQSLYLPLQPGEKHLAKVEFTDETMNDPLRTDTSSELESMRAAQKVALILERYTLFAYSIDPHAFDTSSFIVIEDYQYDLEKLDKRLTVNDVMFKGKKLIVPSIIIRNNLMKYLEKSLLNNTPGVLSMKDQKVIKDYYSTLADFRQEPNQLIFFDVKSVERWRQESSRIRQHNHIYTYLMSEAREPYFYRSRGKVVLIQNTEQLSQSLGIIEKWRTDKVNMGYRSNISPQTNISYIIFSENGEETVEKHDTKHFAHVIEYYNGGYGAILEL